MLFLPTTTQTSLASSLIACGAAVKWTTWTTGRVRTFSCDCFALHCHSASVSLLPIDICFCYSVNKANECPLIHFCCRFYSHCYHQLPSVCYGTYGYRKIVRSWSRSLFSFQAVLACELSHNFHCLLVTVGFVLLQVRCHHICQKFMYIWK